MDKDKILKNIFEDDPLERRMAEAIIFLKSENRKRQA